MAGCVVCLSSGGKIMSKRTVAPRERLRRQGNFWEEGVPLTDTDREILKPLIEKAAELGYTPAKAEVENSARSKDQGKIPMLERRCESGRTASGE